MRPTVRSRRLGNRLKSYRTASGLSGTELADRVGIHQATWSKIEAGKAKLSPPVLAATAEALRIPEEVVTQLDTLRRKAEEPGWWQDYGDILSEAVQLLIELEADASWIRTYEGDLVPGLLQTREYAERVITAVSPHIRVADIDRYLELRMRRQQRLSDGVRLTAVLGEAAIRQRIGGREVMREQLRHIERMVETHDVTIQIVPFAADAHAALGESFAIIQWPDETTTPEAVYADGVTSWTVHERDGVIRSYLHALASVQSQALSPRESLDLVHSAFEELS
ncbi:Transcriptional regulator, contains XRE-family HTH domain [Actinopolyspora lacussalsi subsp. righensis]|uniref:Transcriptional regulator, contains XRE-family HTH domain n=1 Tax=Actinopolyspora righensis TaxID=995060 RepID=A0A1I6Y6W1_9ACTN|nr:helix-turn-helix transcriptional regulator [Actinopolyspora righensis]SFT45961.1 Transcriptional regulator, contains XRE-family HTH domain [Actinopolyspora righensis]